MLFNLTAARTLLSSRLALLPLVQPYFYSTMPQSHPLPAAVLPPTLVPDQGPPKIHLYTVGTPNGYKASVMLEELRAAYPAKAKKELSYDFIPISFANVDQKSPAFLRINPNGRIPAIIDDNYNGKNVWESAAILLWLGNNYDTDHKLTFTDPALNSDMLSWIFFAHGGIGPMQGQVGVFLRHKVPMPVAIKRYIEETSRLYSVLEDGLAANGDWLVGDKFSIADINAFTWTSSNGTSGIDMTPFPRVLQWIDRIAAREGVINGLKVPTVRKLPDAAAAKENVAKGKEWIAEGDMILAEAK